MNTIYQEWPSLHIHLMHLQCTVTSEAPRKRMEGAKSCMVIDTIRRILLPWSLCWGLNKFDVALLKQVCHWDWVVRFQKLRPDPVSFPACGSGSQLLAHHQPYCHHTACHDENRVKPWNCKQLLISSVSVLLLWRDTMTMATLIKIFNWGFLTVLEVQFISLMAET